MRLLEGLALGERVRLCFGEGERFVVVGLLVGVCEVAYEIQRKNRSEAMTYTYITIL